MLLFPINMYLSLLLSSVILFIHLQIILLGLLYTYYYQINKNIIVDNNNFNNINNGSLRLICIYLCIICIIFSFIIYYSDMDNILYSCYYFYNFIHIFYSYIKEYIKYIDNYKLYS
jgi:hypothetical protein